MLPYCTVVLAYNQECKCSLLSFETKKSMYYFCQFSTFFCTKKIGSPTHKPDLRIVCCHYCVNKTGVHERDGYLIFCEKANSQKKRTR